MSAPVAIPGVEGAILSILQDPIAALCLARQIDRDEGAGTTIRLQEAAIAVIAAQEPKEEDHAHISRK